MRAISSVLVVVFNSGLGEVVIRTGASQSFNPVIISSAARTGAVQINRIGLDGPSL